MNNSKIKDTYIGISLAILAVIIWSGNFVVARGVSKQINPVSLAFYRWSMATLLIAPFAWKQFRKEKEIIVANRKYLFWVALTGITLFNTLVYVAGHYTSAINLALIGTTSSPIFATILAVIFLKEKLSRFRMAGIAVCLSGIVLLISKGEMQTFLSFRFSEGDLWVMGGAMAFAIYNVLVRKKPDNISPLCFLFVIFAAGTLMLLPGFIAECFWGLPTQWNTALFSVILYLGLGTSIVSFLCWNIAIEKIGTGRTVLFGNLIPIFSTLEAVWFLNEKITAIHIGSGLLVILGLVLANTKLKSH
jgi:drug/metabolite transporter (DMT)-like permease